jgi:hypothetical protein
LEIAPGLDILAELRWLEHAELADREGITPVAGALDFLSTCRPTVGASSRRQDVSWHGAA